MVTVLLTDFLLAIAIANPSPFCVWSNYRGENWRHFISPLAVDLWWKGAMLLLQLGSGLCRHFLHNLGMRNTLRCSYFLAGCLNSVSMHILWSPKALTFIFSKFFVLPIQFCLELYYYYYYYYYPWLYFYQQKRFVFQLSTVHCINI